VLMLGVAQPMQPPWWGAAVLLLGAIALRARPGGRVVVFEPLYEN
jgi:hypothetical protein